MCLIKQRFIIYQSCSQGFVFSLPTAKDACISKKETLKTKLDDLFVYLFLPPVCYLCFFSLYNYVGGHFNEILSAVEKNEFNKAKDIQVLE